MQELLLIAVGAAFVNNVVLSHPWKPENFRRRAPIFKHYRIYPCHSSSCTVRRDVFKESDASVI